MMKRAGMLLLLAAVACLSYIFGNSCSLVLVKYGPLFPFMQVFRMKKGALMIWAPPCSTWVFLILICVESIPLHSCASYQWDIIYRQSVCGVRSSGTTGRTWLDPGRAMTKAAKQANIFIRRMLYVPPSCSV